MRLMPTPKMQELRRKIEPYVIKDKRSLSIKEDSPTDIRNAYEEYNKLFDEQWKFAEWVEYGDIKDK